MADSCATALRRSLRGNLETGREIEVEAVGCDASVDLGDLLNGICTSDSKGTGRLPCVRVLLGLGPVTVVGSSFTLA